MADIRALRQRALDAVDRGDWNKALGLYEALAKEDRNDPAWPQRSGEMCRKLGRPRDALIPLGRAAELYSKAGQLVKAIAVCKTILEIAPSHTGTQQKLATLYGASRSPAVPLPMKRRPSVAVPAPTAPLEVLPVGRLIAGTRPSQTVRTLGQAMAVEIPLEEDEADGDQSLARSALPKTPFFSALSPRHLQMVIEGVRLVRLAAGEILFERGDAGDALYVVASGAISVGAPRELARLGEGTFFGEIALLTDQPRNARTTAAVPTELLAIDRALVHALLADSPEVLAVILGFLRDRLLATLMQTSPLFAPFSLDERAALAARFVFVEASGGGRLLEEGRPATALYLLLAGRASVSRGGKAVGTLGPGDLCGEVSLLEQTPATETVELGAKSFVLSLPRAGFAELMLTHPQVLEYVSALAESRRRGGPSC
jgi:cAMP-dependent protein kinase regulator